MNMLKRARELLSAEEFEVIASADELPRIFKLPDALKNDEPFDLEKSIATEARINVAMTDTQPAPVKSEAYADKMRETLVSLETEHTSLIDSLASATRQFEELKADLQQKIADNRLTANACQNFIDTINGQIKIIPTSAPPLIPSGVMVNNGVFYDTEKRTPKSQVFHDKWKDRISEFPPDPTL